MGIFDGYLICSDCDGTMTDRKSILQKEDADAINYFQSEGGLFTFATGRFPKYIDKFLEWFHPGTYQVMANGTTLYDVDNRRIVHEVTMDPPKEILEFLRDNGLCHLIYVDHQNHSTGWCDSQEMIERMKQWGDDRVKYPTLDELYTDGDPEPWHKVNFCFDTVEQAEKAEKALKEAFPEETFVRSWATGIEILPRNGGKGACVNKLRELLGDKIHTVVCAGDYDNDISMLEVADIGYAVANASDNCKNVADRITVSNEEHAIRQIIRDLEEDAKKQGWLERVKKQ